MNNDLSTLGARIRSARKAAHMSQSALADKLGKTTRTIQKYESNEISPPIKTIDSIANICAIDLSDLIVSPGTGPMPMMLTECLLFLYGLEQHSNLTFEIKIRKLDDSDGCSCTATAYDNTGVLVWEDALSCSFDNIAKQSADLEKYRASHEDFNRWLDEKLSHYSCPTSDN